MVNNKVNNNVYDKSPNKIIPLIPLGPVVGLPDIQKKQIPVNQNNPIKIKKVFKFPNLIGQ